MMGGTVLVDETLAVVLKAMLTNSPESRKAAKRIVNTLEGTSEKSEALLESGGDVPCVNAGIIEDIRLISEMICFRAWSGGKDGDLGPQVALLLGEQLATLLTSIVMVNIAFGSMTGESEGSLHVVTVAEDAVVREVNAIMGERCKTSGE